MLSSQETSTGSYFFPKCSMQGCVFRKKKKNNLFFFFLALLSSNLPGTELSPCRDNARASSHWRPPGSKLT